MRYGNDHQVAVVHLSKNEKIREFAQFKPLVPVIVERPKIRKGGELFDSFI